MNIRAFLRRWNLLLLLLVLCAGLAIFSQSFLTVSNILNVILQTSIVAITAIGMTFTILSGGIDLSVGSMAAFCGALSAGFIVRHEMNTYLAILLALALGCLLGAVNGVMIVKGELGSQSPKVALSVLTNRRTQSRRSSCQILARVAGHWSFGKL